MEINGSKITFSSGRTVSANRGIVGINSSLELSEGYDASFDWPVPEWWDDEEKSQSLTVDDMRELADHMIGLWSKFKAGLSSTEK